MRLVDETEYQEKLAKIPMEVRTFRKAVEVAEDMPTIDAVPVVRCRECKKKNKKKCPMIMIQFDRNGKELLVQNHVPDDFYCSAGERKEGADNDA